jgi:hypothetical protein
MVPEIGNPWELIGSVARVEEIYRAVTRAR